MTEHNENKPLEAAAESENVSKTTAPENSVSDDPVSQEMADEVSPADQTVPLNNDEPAPDDDVPNAAAVADDEETDEEPAEDDPVSDEPATDTEDKASHAGWAQATARKAVPEDYKATVQGVIEGASQVRHVFKDKYGRSLQPAKIVKSVFKTAKRYASDWGPHRPKQTPNYFDVYVSTYDWEHRYGIEGSNIADKVGKMVLEELEETNYRMEGFPVIIFQEDTEMALGDIRVEASYGTPQEQKERPRPVQATQYRPAPNPDPDPEPLEVDEEPVANAQEEQGIPEATEKPKGDTASPTTESAATNQVLDPTQPPQNTPGRHERSGQVVKDIVNNIGGIVDDLMQAKRQYVDEHDAAKPDVQDDGEQAELEPEVTPGPPPKMVRAFIVWKNKSLTVFPNAILGVSRGGYVPDVELPKDVFVTSVSRDHGVFLYQNDIWYFENHGQHGTTVRFPSGEENQLKANGSKVALCDGAELLFADDSLPTITFTTSL